MFKNMYTFIFIENKCIYIFKLVLKKWQNITIDKLMFFWNVEVETYQWSREWSSSVEPYFLIFGEVSLSGHDLRWTDL